MPGKNGSSRVQSSCNYGGGWVGGLGRVWCVYNITHFLTSANCVYAERACRNA